MKYAQYILIILFGGFMLWGSFVIHARNVGLNVKQMPKVVGRINNSYVTRRPGGGKHRNPPVFAFNLDNLERTIGVYRPSHDYSKLLDSLQAGDTITVYYRPLTGNLIDIDVYQIEKNGRIIVDYKSYSNNYSVAVAAIAVFGSILLVVGILGLRIQMKKDPDQV